MDGPRVVAAWSRRQKLRRRWRRRALASGSTPHSQPAAGSPEVRPDARQVRRGARSQPWKTTRACRGHQCSGALVAHIASREVGRQRCVENPHNVSGPFIMKLHSLKQTSGWHIKTQWAEPANRKHSVSSLTQRCLRARLQPAWRQVSGHISWAARCVFTLATEER